MAFPSASRRTLLRVAAAALAVSGRLAQAQQSTIKLVIGFPPGATLDVITRQLAERLQAELGRSVIVENRTGAGGSIANQAVKSAQPDGTTLLIAPLTTMTMYPHSYPDLPYDPFKDFIPLLHLASFPYAFGVGKNVPAKTLGEYVELVRRDPKFGFFGSAGAGSATHFHGLLLGKAANIEMTHVPYKGTAAVLLALQSGELPAAFVPVADLATVARGGAAHLLGVVGPARHPAFPDLPTFKESGFNVLDEGQYVMFAPAGTPARILDPIRAAAAQALRDGRLRARMQAAYLQPTGYDAKRITAEMRGGYDSWGPIIRNSGFKVDK